MKKLLTVLLTLASLVAWLMMSPRHGLPEAAAQTTSCLPQFHEKMPPALTRPALQASTVGLCFEAFAVKYSGVSRTPLWSAEHLTRDSLARAEDIKREDSFHAEEALPKSYRAQLSDYVRSGYDRGHMSPAADMPTKQAQHESFSLANIVPQNRHNNQVLWSAIEGATRHLTNVRGELYVVTGPIFVGEKVKRLNGRVFIPTHVFKAVLDPATQEAAAWIAANTDGDDYEVVSVAELEKRAKIDVFPKLSASAKQAAMHLPEPQIRSRQSRD
jgi:endonuclease G